MYTSSSVLHKLGTLLAIGSLLLVTGCDWITLASVDDTGVMGDDGSEEASLSSNGRYVAYLSRASNLVPGDTAQRRDVIVHDTVARTTTRVSVSSAGSQIGALRVPIKAQRTMRNKGAARARAR